MAMPVLKYNSVTVGYETNELKTKMDSGRVIARKKFSKTRREITAKTVAMTDSDVDLLVTHFDEVGTVLSFSFTNPDDAEVLTVRFKEPIKYERGAYLKGHYSVATFNLVEV
jgi:hypothetical protein